MSAIAVRRRASTTYEVQDPSGYSVIVCADLSEPHDPSTWCLGCNTHECAHARAVHRRVAR